MKSFTSLEQSKKLSEILPLESADMRYDGIMQELKIPKVSYNGLGTPCWSLAALLNVLPKGTNISTPKPINALSYCCWNQYDEIYADNPVDACYEMILKLHELKML